MTHPVHILSRLLPLLLAIAVVAEGNGFALDSTRTGNASFYHSKGGRGACALPGAPPWDTLYAAINKRDWNGSASCGACLMVRNDSDSVMVRVNDRCGGCRPGGMDLSPAAFRQLAPLGRGRMTISWRFAACPESTLSISRTRGSSTHWSSLQTWGLPWPTDSLSILHDTAWIPFKRARHNHFTARGLPATPWTVRQVDILGRVRIDSSLFLEPGVTLHPDSSRTVTSDSVIMDPTKHPSSPAIGASPPSRPDTARNLR